MIDIKLIRENRDLVKENIKKKFQDEKLGLVDEVYDLDVTMRETQTKKDALKAKKNKLSGEIGLLMKDKKIEEANKIKEEINQMSEEIEELETRQTTCEAEIKKRMMVIPQIMDPSVPIGKDDSENVEVQRFGDPAVPSYEIPYHADIIESFGGMDKEAAGRTSGQGFYYLIGDIARLHEAMLAYARDFMIKAGFTYAIPPFMIHSDVVTGVMSFPEMEAMMYKIEGEDLYLIGTSEHSMIGKFKDQIIKDSELPISMTSYSPCFRKEGGSHGLEERGLYRVHQFEKQE
uniref:aminoacyl--tRNA ligase-related protein n=1 Tax=Candidatus Ventrenecus sp. TaxID=3085654 RepID=UPI003FF00408